ncbi:MAG: 30S ribosomal protein S8 [Patescibacteria group bacterium]
MDPIADMLIRIKNAQFAHKEIVAFGHSKLKLEIAKILERVGYVGSVSKKGRKNKKFIEIELLYDNNGNPKISYVKRLSGPSKRLYRGFREIFRPKNGYGIAIYSTPKGLLTDSEARKEKIGGEALFELW